MSFNPIFLIKNNISFRNYFYTVLILLSLILSDITTYLIPYPSILSYFIIPIFSIIIILFIIDYNLFIKFILISAVTIINDFILRLVYSPLDPEGQGWISLFFIIEIVFSIIIIIIYGFMKLKDHKNIYFVYVLGFTAMTFLYFYYFYTFGLIEYNEASANILESRRNGVFISEIDFPNNIIIIGKDTVIFRQGWVERQTRLNHTGIIRKTEFTDGNNVIIYADGHFDGYGYVNNLLCNVNDTSTGHGVSISKRMNFTIADSTKELLFSFLRSGEWKVIKGFSIKL